jgi:hypothetical protein
LKIYLLLNLAVACLAYLALPVVRYHDMTGGTFTVCWQAGWLLIGTVTTIALSREYTRA